MPVIDKKLLDYLKRVEGFKDYVYDDKTGKPWSESQEGYPTIGYGHKLTKGQVKKYMKRGITEAQASALLREDAQGALRVAKSQINDSGGNWEALDKNRKQMAIDMAFNVKGGLNTFKNFRQALIDDDKERMLEEFTRSFSGSGSPRLKDRNEVFRDTFLGGVREIKPDKQKTKVNPMENETAMEPTTEPTTEPTMEPTTMAKAPNVDEFFQNASYSKQEFEEMAGQMVAKATKLIHHPSTRKNVVKSLATGNPIENVAKLTTNIMQRIDNAIEKSGREVPDEVRVGVADKIMGQVLEVGEATGFAKLDDAEKTTAFSMAVEGYLNQEIKRGRIDKDALAEAQGAYIKGLSSEERQGLDQQLNLINETAIASNDKYRESIRQTTGDTQQSILGGGDEYGA